MLNFNNLIRSIEDRYIELIKEYIKGKITYEEYNDIEKYKVVILKLEYIKKLRQTKN